MKMMKSPTKGLLKHWISKDKLKEGSNLSNKMILLKVTLYHLLVN